ncbi:MAG: hypothetical protein JSR37_07275 [Verrucomicrobia bacterium]|nr:hypothetical protein [Verrucomicrobiota bacterium]MBS0637272.1 hypothetical protein [Verrucomicrobiota bacterium]
MNNMNVNQMNQIQHLAILADIGGQNVIKKLTKEERKTLQLATDLLTGKIDSTKVSFEEKKLQDLTDKMWDNLGSIPKERSNAIVRLFKGIANKFGRISSNSLLTKAQESTKQVSTKNISQSTNAELLKTVISELDQTRRDLKSVFEGSWDQISVDAQKASAATERFEKGLRKVNEDLAKTMAKVTVRNFSASGHQTTEDAFKALVVEMNAHAEKMKEQNPTGIMGAIDSLVDFNAGMQNIYHSFIDKLVNIAKEANVDVYSPQQSTKPPVRSKESIPKHEQSKPTPEPDKPTTTSVKEVKAVEEKQQPTWFEVTNNSTYPIEGLEVIFMYKDDTHRQNSDVRHGEGNSPISSVTKDKPLLPGQSLKISKADMTHGHRYSPKDGVEILNITALKVKTPKNIAPVFVANPNDIPLTSAKLGTFQPESDQEQQYIDRVGPTLQVE